MSIFFPIANKRNRFEHQALSMPAYFLWCFRCFTGWTPLDYIDQFQLFPFQEFLKKLKLTDYQSEIRHRDWIRFGILDYLFIIPGILKCLFYAVDKWGRRGYMGDFSYPALAFIGVISLAMLPFYIINYSLALALVFVLSPFLGIYRFYSNTKWNKNIAVLKSLEIYMDKTNLASNLLTYELYKKYMEFSPDIKKTTLNEFEELSDLQFIPCAYNHHLVVKVNISWDKYGMVIFHCGNKEAMKAIEVLGLYPEPNQFKEPYFKKLLALQCTKLELRELIKKTNQFNMTFTLQQGFRSATSDASEGMQNWANSNIPEVLFNEYIAGFIGQDPLDRQTAKSHQALNHFFLKKGILFQDKSPEDEPCTIAISSSL